MIVILKFSQTEKEPPICTVKLTWGALARILTAYPDVPVRMASFNPNWENIWMKTFDSKGNKKFAR